MLTNSSISAAKIIQLSQLETVNCIGRMHGIISIGQMFSMMSLLKSFPAQVLTICSGSNVSELPGLCDISFNNFSFL